MRTPRELCHTTPIVYSCELDVCVKCGEPLKVAYGRAVKTVQTLTGVLGIAHRPKRCSDPSCALHEVVCRSSQWQQIAPCHCTYGYDVIAHIGWQRQTCCQSFQALCEDLQTLLRISEAEVRHSRLFRQKRPAPRRPQCDRSAMPFAGQTAGYWCSHWA